MATTNLKAKVRTQLGSANARRERKAGFVPAVVYGHGDETLSVSVDALEFNRILSSETGDNTLITLDIEGKKDTALAREIRRHPTRPVITHVDFIRVNVNEAVQAEVPLHLEGESVGEKDGGRLEQIAFTLTIMAKPADIPVSITHDISAIEIGGNVQMSEIVLPEGVTSEIEPDTVLAVVNVPKVEEEPKVEEVEGEEGEGAEGEGIEGEEGATPSADADAGKGDKDKG